MNARTSTVQTIRTSSSAVAALAVLFVLPCAVFAIQRDFNIVTSQSSITVSGSVTASLGTSSIRPQGPGGLTTSYSGTIKTDRGPGTISFLSGSTIDANVSGSWQPLADASDGSAPADYGGRATFLIFLTANFAGRNLVAGLTSGALPIDATGHFDLSAANVTFVSGQLAYRGPGGNPSGVESIAGDGGPLSGSGILTSLIQGAQTTETLTFPIDASFVLQPDATTTINLNLDGQLVATSTFATPLWGDYNQNGRVDAADYLVWRKKVGSGQSLPNDDTPGVGPDDYTRWRGRYGQSSGSGLGSTDRVPEPAYLGLLLTGSLLYLVRIRRL